MTSFVAALPMYDWPEVRAEVDAQWARLRDALRRRGVDAPDGLTRCNADMPAVASGIRDASGALVAPDPATLTADDFSPHALWLHPALLVAQTCWGPMELGMAGHVQVVAQPDYSAFEGGEGELYSSAIVMRCFDEAASAHEGVAASARGQALLPLDLMRGKRLAHNSEDSMSGILALARDLEAQGEGLDIFCERIVSGGHRASVVAVAEGRADVAAIDCRSWDMARRFEPAARALTVVGWTRRRRGLPFITARDTPAETVAILRETLSVAGWGALRQGNSA
jgi:ABC-type phosphate/phosphonate transport system substrate-binding protein